MNLRKKYEVLREYIFQLELFGTHEHLPAWEKYPPMEYNVLAEYLSHYFSSDIVSAGLKPEHLAEAIDFKKPIMDRWTLIEPYWNAARNTEYMDSVPANKILGFGGDYNCGWCLRASVYRPREYRSRAGHAD